jgi:hypothetical protein
MVLILLFQYKKMLFPNSDYSSFLSLDLPSFSLRYGFFCEFLVFVSCCSPFVGLLGIQASVLLVRGMVSNL